MKVVVLVRTYFGGAPQRWQSEVGKGLSSDEGI